MTTAALVRSTLGLTRPEVLLAAEAFWTAPGLRERYPGYLGAMHGLIRASVPLMQEAEMRCAALPAHDSSGPVLAAYFREHIAEELGHDDWLLEDLAVLGGPEAGDVLAQAPAAEVAALAGAQYYWLRHYHPACLLGYIAVLEGCPPDQAVLERLPGLTGLPPAAFRTLAVHATADPGHLAEVDRLFGELALPAPVGAAVARSAAYTARQAAGILRGLIQPGLPPRRPWDARWPESWEPQVWCEPREQR